MNRRTSTRRALVCTAALLAAVPAVSAAAAPGKPSPAPAAPQIAYFAYSLQTGNSQEDIFTINPGTTKVTRVINEGKSLNPVSDRDPRWSADRKKLLIFRCCEFGTQLVVIDAVTGADDPAFVKVPVDSAVGNPGGAWFDATRVVRADEGAVVVTDMSSGGDVPVVAGEVVWFHDPETENDIPEGWYADSSAWNTSGGLVVSFVHGARVPFDEGTGYYPGNDDSEMRIFSPAQVQAALASGTPLARVAGTQVDAPATTNGYGRPDWSSAGDRITYAVSGETSEGAWTSDVWLTDLAAGTTTNVTATPDAAETDPALSPDGRTIAYVAGYEDAWTDIFTLDVSTRANRALTHNNIWYRGGLDW